MKWSRHFFSSLNEARVCEAIDKQIAEMHSLVWPLGDRKLRKEEKMHLKKQKLEKRENFYFADFEEEGRATIHVISRSLEMDGNWITSGLLREHITAHTLILVQWYLFWCPGLQHCKIINLFCFKLLFFFWYYVSREDKHRFCHFCGVLLSQRSKNMERDFVGQQAVTRIISRGWKILAILEQTRMNVNVKEFVWEDSQCEHSGDKCHHEMLNCH